MVRNPNTIFVENVNGQEVVGHLRHIASSLDAQLNKVAGFLAEDMSEVAKDLVAKDELKVMKSIRTERRGDGWNVVADRGGERDETAVYLEIGTHKMAPRPYMVPAMKLTLASGGLLKATRQAGGLLGQTGGL